MLKCMMAAAGGVMLCAVAQAADLPASEEAYKAIASATYNWTGLYVGGYAGYGWGQAQARDAGNSSGLPFYSAAGQFSARPTSFNGGGQVGFNYQFGRWVAGLEGDIGSLRLNGQGLYNDGVFLDTFVTTRSSYVATLRGRLGFAVDRNFFYATGGGVWGDFDSRVKSFGPFITNTTGNSQSGWVIGGGWEYAFSNQWSVKTEYLHYDAGTKDTFLNNATPNRFPITVTGDLARVGLNYHFGK